MAQFIAALLSLTLALCALSLRKTYNHLPAKEYKRRARAGDKTAKVLYRAVAYGDTLHLLLWIVIVAFMALGLELFARLAPVPFGLLVVALVLWLGLVWMPRPKAGSLAMRLAVWLTHSVVWVLVHVNPVFSWLTQRWQHRFAHDNHSGLYETEDLVRLVEQQKLQPDNRIAPEVLDVIDRALHFDKYRVRDITVPATAVRAVSHSEPVGPVLLDELHATGYARFPVYDGKPDAIVGTLHLITLDEAKHGGQVSDYIDKRVAYLHEGDSLAEALEAVHATKQQLFVVVNSFEEYLGITTLEDILYALLGPPLTTEFDSHYDAKAVASKRLSERQTLATEATNEPETTAKLREKVAQTSSEVVE